MALSDRPTPPSMINEYTSIERKPIDTDLHVWIVDGKEYETLAEAIKASEEN